MDDHEEAMVTFSQGLATNPKESAMVTALVETMVKSSLKVMFLHDMYYASVRSVITIQIQLRLNTESVARGANCTI